MAESNTRTRSRPDRARRPDAGRDRHGKNGGRRGAEEHERDEQRRPEEHERDEREPSDTREHRRIPAMRLVESAKAQLTAMTGKVAESASGIAERDGGWCVTVEMVELERIPPTTSILGTYEAQIDREGNVLGFERVRRYSRSDADG